MYIPTYKQVILFVVGLALIFVSVAKLSHTHGTSRGAATHSDDTHMLGSPSAPAPPLKTKQSQFYARRESVSDGIWYSYDSSADRRDRARRAAELDLPAFCTFLKDAGSRELGDQRTSDALWYLSQNENKFTQFRAQRIESYDEKLEDTVTKSMTYVIRWLLRMFDGVEVGADGHGGVSITCTGNASSVGFSTPSLRVLSDITSLSAHVGGRKHRAREKTWISNIHLVWHALRVMLPALRDLHLVRAPHLGRNLTFNEALSVGRAVGVKGLVIDSCAYVGMLWHLQGSRVADSIDKLVLKDAGLRGLDAEAVGTLCMRELRFHHTTDSARGDSLARILERREIMDRLTRLHIVLLDSAGISEMEADAIAGLRKIQTLSLAAEKSECAGRVARILNGTFIAARLRELSLAFSSISLVDTDAVADLNLDSLSLSCRSITDVHISRIGAGAAGKSITRLGLKNMGACLAVGELAAFRRLRSLRLEQYTVSRCLWRYERAALIAGIKQVKRLELVNRRLASLLMMLVAAKSDLEELVLAIDELKGSELRAMLENKSRLRTLEITGGSVAEVIVDMIPKLNALTRLKLSNVTITYG